jgi:hypothetical protein
VNLLASNEYDLLELMVQSTSVPRVLELQDTPLQRLGRAPGVLG